MAEPADHLQGQRAPSVAGKLARNVVSNWGGYAFSLVVNFFLAPYVVRRLGDTGYGVWALLVSLTGYLGLLDLGVRGAVTRFVARFHTAADHRGASSVTSSALLIFSVAGGLAILASVLLALFGINSFNIPREYRTAAQVVLVLGGINIALSLISGVFAGIIVGLQRFDLSNVVEMGVTALRAIAIVLALASGKGIVVLACIQLVFTLSRAAASISLSRHLYGELRVRPDLVSREHLKLIFSFSLFSFLIHVGASMIYYTDSVVIGYFLPVGAITLYAIGGTLVDYGRGLFSSISQAITPMASALQARRDDHQLQEVLLLGSRCATMAALPVALTFIIRGKTFIGLWMGPHFAEVSGNVLWVLALTMLFWPANTSAAGVMLGTSKHKPLVPLLLTEGVCNLALSIVLIKTMGVIGVAWGTAVPSLAVSLVFWPWYVRRSQG